MAVLPSSHTGRKTKRQSRSFTELIGQLGQRSKPTAPKYADSTTARYAGVWRQWTQFCQKVYKESDHFPSPDPVEVCENRLSYEVVRAFLEWSCETSGIKSSSSLFTHAKCWRMAVLVHTRYPVAASIKMNMKNFIMDTLIDRFELKETGRFRAVMDANDVLAILHHHWVLSDEYYPEERQRLQHVILNIFCASTTSRAGTVVESSGYYGQNQAVEYGDIQLYAVRDEEILGGVKLGMLIQLRLLKGRRNRGNPPMIKFKERQDVPSFCLIKAICGLAFKDRAFASEWIREPEDFYKIKIPNRLNSVPIEWAADWQEVPVLRRSVRDSTGKVYTSPTQAAQFNQMATWNRRLGRSLGMKDSFEFKMLRRAAVGAPSFDI